MANRLFPAWPFDHRRAPGVLAAAALLVLLISGCGSGGMPLPTAGGAKAPGPTTSASRPAESFEMAFRDIAASVGLDWTFHNGEERELFSIVESMGGGIGLCDFDQDGRLDVVAAGGGDFPAPRAICGRPVGCFRQGADGRYENVAKLAGLGGEQYYNHGIAAGDYDNDGFPDLAVTGYGGLLVYHNQGDGTFRHAVGRESVFAGGWSVSAAWGDVNGDGNPDLFAAHYADWSFDNDPPCTGPAPHPRDVCPPRRFRGLRDQLFLNDGTGEFREAAQELGLDSDRKGIGVALADIDGDGHLDIYVANDTDPNDLYHNDGTGHFREVGLAAGVALGADTNADGSMGVDVGDFNGDGLIDVWVTNYERESFALYQNLGQCRFRHVSRGVGITAWSGSSVGWGTSLIDVDSDGDEDIFVANGHVIHFPTHSQVRQLPFLFENDGGKAFRNQAELAGEYLKQPHSGRGVAQGDIDNDGDPDLVVSNVNEPLALLSNETPVRHGLGIRLIGRTSPRQPVGAVVRCRFGNRTITRQFDRAASYASTNSDTLYFGLGNSAEPVTLEIRWPSGQRQVVDSDASERSLTIIEPQ